jgi:15-cis-phytoene synthase
MTSQKNSWKNELIHKAQQAMDGAANENCLTHYKAEVIAESYRYCREVTRFHSRTFYMAAGLMPVEKRQAVYALYAFCRVCDDLVDKGSGNIQGQLEHWRSRLDDCVQTGQDAVAIAWADTRYKYQIPSRYAEQLIQGLSQDLVQTRYQTFPQLAAYCYGAASTVGLMSMHIVGYTGPEALPYAVQLGVALQMTNILRDVGEDLRSGRIYLPLQELESFGLSEEDIRASRVTPKWREFMKFQIHRTRQLYQDSMPGISHLDPAGRFSIAAAAELYRLILDKIEDNDYDVFNTRASVSKWGKISRLPGIWFRSRSGRYPLPNSSLDWAENHGWEQ